jgi:hypothetical protein
MALAFATNVAAKISAVDQTILLPSKDDSFTTLERRIADTDMTKQPTLNKRHSESFLENDSVRFRGTNNIWLK